MNTGKRVFDLFWTILGLLILSPLFLIVSLAIKIEDGGSVFFRQKRIGLNGKPFYILKFRTMKVGADKRGPLITTREDPRITKKGIFLRKYKIDELPQLINVLKGEMSLVGPRPEVEKYVNLYDSYQKKVLKFLPGITDLASIKFKNENELLKSNENPEKKYIEEIMPEKIKLNLDYAEKATVWKDFKIILKTIFGPN